MASPARVLAFPSTDHAFRRVVQRVVEASAISTSGDLETHLRATYPEVTVRARELSGEPDPVWYAFRDGGYSTDSHEDWWSAAGTAEVRLSTHDGRVAGVNDALTELIATPADRVVGDDYLNYVEPAARVGAAALFEAALAYGGAHSLVKLLRGDGTLVACEFHATTTPSEIVVRFRPVGEVRAESQVG